MRISLKRCLRFVGCLVVCVLLYLTVFQLSYYRTAADMLRELKNLTTDEIKELSFKMNAEQYINNSDAFSLKLNNESVVILVQVHNRMDTLRMLVSSLRTIRFINESLVIFSHDFYNPELFRIIQSIDFCQVLQIFYPYTIQVYYDRFPGSHPNDCPRDIPKWLAKKMKCNNAFFPDLFNHYRQAPICQLKHHWLWKMHFVFDRVTVLHGYKGTVLLVEDDYYLSSDVIYFIRKLKQVQKTDCPSCKAFILGEYEKYSRQVFTTSSENVRIQYFYNGIGRGTAISRAYWNDLKRCANHFCLYDEYNYDFSLYNAVCNCVEGGLKVMKSATSRVFHIGRCGGVHKHDKHCNVTEVVENIKSILRYKTHLFPKSVSVVKLRGKLEPKLRRVFGGWADPRDHQLCMSFINNVSDSEQLLIDIHSHLLTMAEPRPEELNHSEKDTKALAVPGFARLKHDFQHFFL